MNSYYELQQTLSNMKIRVFLKKLFASFLPYKTYLGFMNSIFFLAYKTKLLRLIKDGEYFYLIRKLIKPGYVCIDIGANMGHYTVILSKLVGPEGKVFAVEPVPPIIEILKHNIKNLSNVEILPFALGDKDGKVKMSNLAFLNRGFISSGSHFIITKDAPNDNEVLFTVEMKKGSEVFKHLSRLDFIKCDVEGYEAYIIEELADLIKKFKPIILIEVWRKNLNKLTSILDPIGYKYFVLAGPNKLQPITRKANQFRGGDILCIHSEKLNTILDDSKLSIS